MIKFILCFLMCGSAFANTWLQSGTLSLNTVTSDSELRDTDDKEILTFRPNVATSFGVSVETEYVNIGYFFAGNQAQSFEHEKSQYSDFRFNFHWQHFDFRLNYQKYSGAIVDEAGIEEFYHDYEMSSLNARMHYYFNPEHLNYIREGKNLVSKISGNSGFNASTSWFLGLNVDSRSIELPEDLDIEHENVINASGISYDRSFSAFSAGPLGGYDFLLQWSKVYFRGKLGYGAAFQTGGGSVPQYEVALNTGFALFQRHLFSLGVDLYTMSFKDSDQRIQNSNSQAYLAYTYAFDTR